MTEIYIGFANPVPSSNNMTGQHLRCHIEHRLSRYAEDFHGVLQALLGSSLEGCIRCKLAIATGLLYWRRDLYAKLIALLFSERHCATHPNGKLTSSSSKITCKWQLHPTTGTCSPYIGESSPRMEVAERDFVSSFTSSLLLVN